MHTICNDCMHSECLYVHKPLYMPLLLQNKVYKPSILVSNTLIFTIYHFTKLKFTNYNFTILKCKSNHKITFLDFDICTLQNKKSLEMLHSSFFFITFAPESIKQRFSGSVFINNRKLSTTKLN